jgi:CHAT domain-containing protein
MLALRLTTPFVVLIGIFLSVAPALALTMDQAKESCKPKAAPLVTACMQSMGAGDREAKLAKCKARSDVYALVSNCMMAALNAANGRANVAIQTQVKTETAPIGNALPAGFVPPPRTIADIAAILDSEKPDAAVLAKRAADAEAQPNGKTGNSLAVFYYDRAVARASLGRFPDAISDTEKSLGIARGSSDAMFVQRVQTTLGQQKQSAGDLKGTIAIFQQVIRETSPTPLTPFRLFAMQSIMLAYIQSGDVSQADGFLRSSQAILTEARTSGIPRWREAYEIKGRSWEATVESSRAIVLESRGQYREAEQAYVKASEFRQGMLTDMMKPRFDAAPARDWVLQQIDTELMNAARMKAKQGRFAEAEVGMRSALLARLRAQGKYHPSVPGFIVSLASVLIDEGRYEEAEKLTRAALDIQRAIGIADETQASAQMLSQIGAVLIFQHKTKEAAEIYAHLDGAIAKWEPSRRENLLQNGSRIAALLASGQVQEAVATAEGLVKRQSARLGEKNFDTASARGTLAIGYMKAGRDADAAREFKAAIPVLMAASRENADDEDSSVTAGRSERLRAIVEKYIELAARTSGNAEAAAETFALADSIRGQQVQSALDASSARSAVKDPALIELVRKEQDLGKQINAQLGALNNALSSDLREENVINATKASIEKFRNERDRARGEIIAKFPAYADLVSPKSPTIEQIKSALAPEEAMLSFYFGRDASFVWAVPKDGAVAFAAIPATSGDIESKVRKLREALEPQAAMISDIPEFDLKLGYELYSLLLKPVETGWTSSRNLIVVTNGALGLLPLSLLPVDPAQVIASSDDALFSNYRGVHWLARTHAVTMVPSAAALRTLRQLPPGKSSRQELIAFGDPIFSKAQADEAEKAATVQVAAAQGSDGVPAVSVSSNLTRGVPLKRRSAPKLEGVDSAELAMLPRLPDTADELKSIALALQVDPSKVLNLGKDANEGAVKTLDLSGFKIIAFATHGIVPGELNGLTQPALALSAPDVSGTPGDGLLTMEEILGLKLDADWVVLSACNTGAGDGAEAASGLGRAFFYAGTRAILVTNWSVHSQSARELVTDLFKRQAADATMTRGEALREAMMALIDGQGYTNAQGKTEFAYAHPLFWAPYSIIGDGGRR